MQVQAKMLAIYKTICSGSGGRVGAESFRPLLQDLATLEFFGPLKKATGRFTCRRPPKKYIILYGLLAAVYGAFYENCVF